MKVGHIMNALRGFEDFDLNIEVGDDLNGVARIVVSISKGMVILTDCAEPVELDEGWKIVSEGARRGAN